MISKGRVINNAFFKAQRKKKADWMRYLLEKGDTEEARRQVRSIKSSFDQDVTEHDFALYIENDGHVEQRKSQRLAKRKICTAIEKREFKYLSRTLRC